MNEDVYIFYQIKHGDVPASHVSVQMCIVYTFIDYNKLYTLVCCWFQGNFFVLPQALN